MGIEQTQEILAKHHRDGAWFAELMRETYAGRFDEKFWNSWEALIEPVLGPTPRILDLGSGPGLFLRDLTARYPEGEAIGVECAPYMLEAMGELPPRARVIESDLHDPRLPLEAGSVDAALASVVLHEMSQPIRALKEVRRCLKPGGRLYLLDWVRAPLERYLAEEADEARVFGDEIDAAELDDIFTHFIEHNRFSIDDLAYLLERCGFRLLDKTPLKEGRFARLVAEKSA